MNFSIVILTGGSSSRMGTDKSQLYFQGKTILDHLIQLSIGYSDDVFVAGNNVITSPQVHCFPDRLSDKGPLSGIQSALENARYEWVLILACDMPLLDTELLNWLTKELESVENEKIAIASAGKEHYLVGFYHRSILSTINHLITTENLSVKQLLSKFDYKKLNVPEQMHRFLTNVNSPKDLDTFGLMKVKIIAFGKIAEVLKKKELEWISEAEDISGLKTELHEAFPELKALTFRFALNESLIDNAPISMNDTIALLPPFAGG